MNKTLDSYRQQLKRAIDDLPDTELERFMELLYRTYKNSNQVFVLGNGGSASTASHMAADLAKNTIETHQERFKIVSLNDNGALLTALANDLEYEEVFAEQLITFLQPGDVVVAISGSGNSPNVLRALEVAHAKRAQTVGFLGMGGGRAAALCDIALVVNSDKYGIIEDVHLIINHILVEYFADRLQAERPWNS